MLVGMGTVFAFLLLLILATNLMSRVANFLHPQSNAEAQPTSLPKPSDDGQTIAVISAAIHAHRARRK